MKKAYHDHLLSLSSHGGDGCHGDDLTGAVGILDDEPPILLLSRLLLLKYGILNRPQNKGIQKYYSQQTSLIKFHATTLRAFHENRVNFVATFLDSIILVRTMLT